MKIIFYFQVIGIVFFFGCSPTNPDDFRHEGQALVRALMTDLGSVHTRDDLIVMEPILKKRFELLALLMIEARQFQIDHSDAVLTPIGPYDVELNDQLQEELARVYRIETGHSIIERAQREAMLRLDAFERNISK
ncbi:MAG: hypothetical protein NT065_01640 [Chlamydiae bacterium]|nr:hypothetical protein [Chlamydiota bacterium]